MISRPRLHAPLAFPLATLCAAFALQANVACSGNKARVDAPAPAEKSLEEEAPEGKEGDASPLASRQSKSGHTRTSAVSEFLDSEVAAPLETVRRDTGEVLLVNDKGDVAIVGTTRSRVTRTPELGGDLFFARYALGKGWDAKRVQVPVSVPAPLLPTPIPPPADAPAGTPAVDVSPTPLAQPLVEAKGGRLLASGKALVVGELKQGSRFLQTGTFLEETAAATQTIFLSVFGAGENGMTSTVRFGLTGVNAVVGTAPSSHPERLMIAGRTESGLRRNVPGGLETQTTEASNFVAELGDDGVITKHVTWPERVAPGLTEHVRGLASHKEFAFASFLRTTSGGEGMPTSSFAYVRSLRPATLGRSFQLLAERPVCEEASQGARAVTLASIDAREGEVVVAVEIENPSVSNGMVLPCFEVFEVTPRGALLSKREVVALTTQATVKGTTRASFVDGGRILLARSRENTDSRGTGEVVVTFLYDRPLSKEGYESSLWSLSRPTSHPRGESVDGLARRVKALVWPQGTPHKDVAWILSNDVTSLGDEAGTGVALESLTHLGTYGAKPRAASAAAPRKEN